MSLFRAMLVVVGALCGVFALILIPQLSHATYYGDSRSGWRIVAIAAVLICVAALCIWGSCALTKRR